jgi:hypothetical protein
MLQLVIVPKDRNKALDKKFKYDKFYHNQILSANLDLLLFTPQLLK